VGHLAGATLVAALLAAASPVAAAEGAPTAVPATRHARAARRASPLEARVALLARALDLDARQQAGVKRILEAHRGQVVAIWNDTSIPAAQRVVATQALGDKTIEQIRALLDDTQRKKLPPPRQAHGGTGPGASLVEWMSQGPQR
jgi:hypothetical protein